MGGEEAVGVRVVLEGTTRSLAVATRLVLSTPELAQVEQRGQELLVVYVSDIPKPMASVGGYAPVVCSKK